MAQRVLDPIDPAVGEVQKALQLATSSGPDPEVIKSTESALELSRLREDFANYATSKGSTTLNKIEEETERHDWDKVHREGNSVWRLGPLMLTGKALDVLKDLNSKGEKFDIIFLDADKDEYLDYMKLFLDGGLLNQGGTILVDNAFFYGDAYIPSKGDTPTKQFVDAVAADPSLHKVLVPLRDGVLMIRRQSDVEGGV